MKEEDLGYFEPVYFYRANSKSEDEKPIPFYSDSLHCVTMWRLNFKKRLKFLITGKLFLSLETPEQPPVTICLGNPIEPHGKG